MFHFTFCTSTRAQSPGLLCQFLLALPYLSVLDRRSLESVSSFFTCWDFGVIGLWLSLDDSQNSTSSCCSSTVISCACLATRDSHGWGPFRRCAKARLSVEKWKESGRRPQHPQINVVILKKNCTCITIRLQLSWEIFSHKRRTVSLVNYLSL